MTRKKLILILAIASCLMLLFAITTFAASSDGILAYYDYNGAGNASLPGVALLRQLYIVGEKNGTLTIEGIRDKVIGDTPTAAIKINTIYIPQGVNYVNLQNSTNSGVKRVVFDFRCDVRVDALDIQGLEEIVISGEAAKVTFGANCSATTLKKISITSSRATVVFEENAFSNRALLNTLDISKCTDLEIVSSYTFGKNAFRNTAIKELKLDDDRATYKFNGIGAFSNCAKLENVYLGKTVTDVGDNAFENCNALKLVYADALTRVGSNAFAISKGSVDRFLLKVYIHTNGLVSINRNAFTNRNSNGVVVCTLETDNKTYDNCNYELHFGIPHKYTEVTGISTCYVTYTTDCPCQKIGNAYYRLYEKGKNEQSVMMVSGPVTGKDVVHTFSDAHKLEYPNGIEADGVVLRQCASCGLIAENEKRVDPVLIFLGYSASEAGTKTLVAGVRFNYESLKLYEKINGETLDYGFVLAGEDKLGGANPFNEDGTLASGAMKMSMVQEGYYESVMKISGFTANADKRIIFAVYIKMGKEIKYFQGDGETKKPVGVSYSQFAK